MRPRLKIHAKLLKTLSNETKQTNRNEHVDGVTNSVQRGNLEKDLQEKFWELQKKQSSQKPFSQEFFTGANYYKGIDSEWNKFVDEIDSIHELTLYIHAERGQSISCHAWIFPCKIQIGGGFDKLIFTASTFKNEIVTTTGFVGKADFSCSTFTKGASFCGEFLEAIFTQTKFINSSITFFGVSFKSAARFPSCVFENCQVNFFVSVFLENVWFSLVKISGHTGFKFEGCEFRGRFDFSALGDSNSNSEITEISLAESEFLKTVLFRQQLSDNLKFIGVNGINFTGAIFREPLVIKLPNPKKSPDFSKSYLLDTKKLSINESWEVKEDEIEKDDESKFRFLKKYFAEQGNHFKEQEYFSYEMMARKELLRSKVFSWSEMKKDFYGWLKNLSEFVLFFAYKLTSNFGMSWIRPLICLLVSALLLQSYLEVPRQNYFSFFNEFFVLRIEGISFWEALLKTISPLSTVEEFKDSLPVKVHSSFNVLLIFLLGLGLRNKFKVK